MQLNYKDASNSFFFGGVAIALAESISAHIIVVDDLYLREVYLDPTDAGVI